MPRNRSSGRGGDKKQCVAFNCIPISRRTEINSPFLRTGEKVERGSGTLATHQAVLSLFPQLSFSRSLFLPFSYVIFSRVLSKVRALRATCRIHCATLCRGCYVTGLFYMLCKSLWRKMLGISHVVQWNAFSIPTKYIKFYTQA